MMKRPLVAALMLLYPLVAFGAAKTDGVDTSSLENAQTFDDLKTAYQDTSNEVMKKYDKQIDREEIIAAQGQVLENIEALDEALAEDALKAEKEAKKNQDSEPEPTLTEEQSQAKIDELEANAEALREQEQSLGNRLASGAAMGAMGIGGQMIGSALAEQNADAAAERDMTAYLATFKCDYGAGMNITGGTMNVELPGANILLPIYTEYVTLAADLKTRKEALGMTPGIESNEILDAATSGLYDDVSTGVTGGSFASIARALMNPEGADAAAWAAQKSETSEQLKTGAITAGVGAVVGIAGNAIFNTGKNKVENKSKEIIAKYDAMKTLKESVDKLPASDEDAKCPTGSTGTYPNCKCNGNNVYSSENTCVPCEGDLVPDENGTRCVCPSGKVPDETNNTKCNTPTTTIARECKLTGAHVNITDCVCVDGFKPNTYGTGCECVSPRQINPDGLCIEVPANMVVDETNSVDLDSNKLFALNSCILQEDAKAELLKFVGAAELITRNNEITDWCIKVVGHTDKSGRNAINNTLSKKRAKSVRDALVEDGEVPESNVYWYGVGSAECATTTENGQDEECRKVVITYLAQSCEAVKESEKKSYE